MMKIRAEKKQSGFTLVEVLVAISIMTMVSMVGYGGVIFCLKQWEKGESRLHATVENFHGVRFLRERISSAKRTSYSVGSKTYVEFSGDKQGLRFVSKFANAPQAGLYVCHIGVENKSLRLKYNLYHPEAGNFDSMPMNNSQGILSSIKRVKFSYFGSVTAGSDKWYETWKKNNQLPKMVKYSIDFEDGKIIENVIFIETADS